LGFVGRRFSGYFKKLLSQRDFLVSAEVLPPSLKINDLAFANVLSGPLFGKGNFPNSLIDRTIDDT